MNLYIFNNTLTSTTPDGSTFRIHARPAFSEETFRLNTSVRWRVTCTCVCPIRSLNSGKFLDHQRFWYLVKVYGEEDEMSVFPSIPPRERRLGLRRKTEGSPDSWSRFRLLSGFPLQICRRSVSPSQYLPFPLVVSWIFLSPTPSLQSFPWSGDFVRFRPPTEYR